jgi:hypothetical protein
MPIADERTSCSSFLRQIVDRDDDAGMTPSHTSNLLLASALLASALPLTGCGTTRSTDSLRTATEQLLISDAIDRAVQMVSVDPLAGKAVYLDESKLSEVVDRNYLISTLRQHLMANGCILRDKREDAEFIIEARAGAVGTDRSDLLFGLPSVNVPPIMPFLPLPSAVPEIPFAKRRDQRGIAKIAIFAYHRESGQAVWQSGITHEESSSNDVWILGAGPFQRGSIHDGVGVSEEDILRGVKTAEAIRSRQTTVALEREKTFPLPRRVAGDAAPSALRDETVVQAVHIDTP